jgi:hypothetical protein
VWAAGAGVRAGVGVRAAARRGAARGGAQRGAPPWRPPPSPHLVSRLGGLGHRLHGTVRHGGLVGGVEQAPAGGGPRRAVQCGGCRRRAGGGRAARGPSEHALWRTGAHRGAPAGTRLRRLQGGARSAPAPRVPPARLFLRLRSAWVRWRAVMRPGNRAEGAARGPCTRRRSRPLGRRCCAPGAQRCYLPHTPSPRHVRTRCGPRPYTPCCFHGGRAARRGAAGRGASARARGVVANGARGWRGRESAGARDCKRLTVC